MAAGDVKQRLQEFSVSPPREHVVSTIFALSIERMQSCVLGGAKERTWYLIVQAHHWQKGVTHHSRREYFGRGHREHYTPHSPAPPPILRPERVLASINTNSCSCSGASFTTLSRVVQQAFFS